MWHKKQLTSQATQRNSRVIFLIAAGLFLTLMLANCIQVLPEGDFTHMVPTDTVYYTTGPQQGRPPDGTFGVGTKVWLLEKNGSYARVRTGTDIEAYVAIESLAPLPTSEETGQ